MVKEWQLVFEDVSILDNKITETLTATIILDDKRICLGKHQGIFYAIEDTCPHQEASLGKGRTLPSGGVQCPFHHYVFDIRTGECMVGACRDLETYKLRIENNQLFIQL